MKLLLVNGPNLNFLGIREKGIYGTNSFDDLLSMVQEKAQKEGIELETFQSNCEGALIDKLQEAYLSGVDGIIIPERRSAQVNDTVMRISEGGANHVKIARVVNLNTAIEKLKDNGFWVTGAELGGEDLYKADLTGKLCLVIGSEGFGIRKLVKENCDRIVTIPMRGKVNSLNASVACGIVLFEALRQRNGK